MQLRPRYRIGGENQKEREKNPHAIYLGNEAYFSSWLGE
jgi:hypothetical protein